MNEPLSNSERYPLQGILLEDIFSFNKTALLLLFAIIVTAVSSVWITHKTRSLISEKGTLIFEKQALDNEFTNLQVEETTQSNNKRIEDLAKKLGMEAINADKEVVILE